MNWKVMRVCLMLIVLMSISACDDNEVHEEQYESNVIRIYDVEPLENWNVQVDQHYMRIGVLPHIEEHNSLTAPFANQIEAIEEKTGAEIEYVVVGNWEELRKEQEAFEDANVTEMILFNNTYDESIIKEVTSGKYANMDAALEEYGFYDEEAYNQEILQAGMLETGQMLVPILYNVSGMIHGDAQEYDYEEWKELAYGHAETAKIDFEDFITMLNDAMVTTDVSEMEIPFLSGADYEDRIDLFLTAAGGRWDGYRDQEEIFQILYEYLKIYQETQVDNNAGEKTNQQLYMQHIREKQYTTAFDAFGNPARITRKIADDLQIDTTNSTIAVTDVTEMFLFELIRSMFERTNYFVESTGTDDIAFHSVYGLLAYRNYYVVKNFSASNSMIDFEVYTSGNMEYWPIGIYGSKYEYAAVPICYAAVVEGGDTRLAAKVLQSMMDQETDIKFGISLSNQTTEKQVDTWVNMHDDIGKVRIVEPKSFEQGEQKYSIFYKFNYWGTYVSDEKRSSYFEDKEIYAGQIEEQIKNITTAQIPDRELLTIWEETLTEAVDFDLSAEDGFALLCKRMDAWYK